MSFELRVLRAALVLSAFVISSCSDLTGFDSIDRSICSQDIIRFETRGVSIAVETDAVSKAAEDFVEYYVPPEFASPDSSDYWENIQEEMREQIWSEHHYVNPENFRFARYYYDGYLSDPLINMKLFADANKKITAIELRERNEYNDDRTETFYFEGNEVLLITRSNLIPHLEGFAPNIYYSHTSQQEKFKFDRNSLLTIEKRQRDREKDSETTSSYLSETEAKRVLKMAMFFKYLGQSILDDANLNCVETTAKLGKGTNQEITDYFNQHFDSTHFQTIDHSKFIFGETFHIRINAGGKVDSIRVMFEDKHKSSPLMNNEEYYQSVLNEVKNILLEMKWNPATENCQPVSSEKEIPVTYNYIYEVDGSKKGWKMDLNSGHFKKFTAGQWNGTY